MRSVPLWPTFLRIAMPTPEQLARMTIRELLDLNPQVRRYLLVRSPDI